METKICVHAYRGSPRTDKPECQNGKRIGTPKKSNLLEQIVHQDYLLDAAAVHIVF